MYNILSPQKQNDDSESLDNAEFKSFVQAHIPEARLKEAQRGDLVYSLPPFSSSNASAYRSLLTALDANLDALQLGGYGISDTTLEEVSRRRGGKTMRSLLSSRDLVVVLTCACRKRRNLIGFVSVPVWRDGKLNFCVTKLGLRILISHKKWLRVMSFPAVEVLHVKSLQPRFSTRAEKNKNKRATFPPSN